MTRQKNRYPGVYAYQTETGERWACVFDVGSGPLRKQSRKSGFLTQKAARAYRDEMQTRARAGDGPPERTTMTTRQYLESWLASRSDFAPGSVKSVGSRIQWVCGYVGDIPLQRLSTAALDRAYADRHRAGFRPSSIRDAHKTIKQALSRAVDHGLIRVNPCDKALPPKGDRKLTVSLSQDEMIRFLLAADDDLYWGTMMRVFASTWIRFGELADLRWNDIDWTASTLTISHQMQRIGQKSVSVPVKTAKGNRVIPIDPDLLGRLKTYQDWQRSRSPHPWRKDGLVFPGKRFDEWLVNPSVAHAIRRYCKLAGVTEVTPHGLRHSGASIAYGAGVSPKIVSERLGHSDVAFTSRVYIHTKPDQHHAAAATIAALLTNSETVGDTSVIFTGTDK